MRNLSICVILFIGVSTVAFGKHVSGYYRKDGAYVQGYERSAPDNTVNNNWSTKGNYNPYTGKEGSKPQNPYQSGYTGESSDSQDTE